MPRKKKDKFTDEKIKKFLKNLPVTPCLRKRDPMFCSLCIEKNWEVAEYCTHVASEIYGATPIHKEASAKKPEKEEIVKFKPIPKHYLVLSQKNQNTYILKWRRNVLSLS